jgi:hypothetical protein
MRSSTPTLIAALRILANDIQSEDGVANAAIAEAADRLQELNETNSTRNNTMKIEVGQWWQTRCAGKAHIRYVAPEEMDYPVMAVLFGDGYYSEAYCANGRYYIINADSEYDLITYLPDCTGWDWEPPKPVDPGEGWRLLEVGELIRFGDEWWDADHWTVVENKDTNVQLYVPTLKVRRRIQSDVPADWKLVGGVPGGMLYFRPMEGQS